MPVKIPICLVPASVAGHIPDSSRGAPGTVGRSPPTPARIRAGARPQIGPWRVLVAETGVSKLTEPARASARTVLLAELKSVTRASKKHDVKAGFKLIWKSGLAESEARGLGLRDFVVYLMPGQADPKEALKLAQRHVPISAGQVNRTLGDLKGQLDAEGGAHLSVGDRSVSIVALGGFELLLARPDLPPAVQRERGPKVGRRLAELILHELGHAMHASHGSGIMAASLSADPDAPPRHYSRKSREIMRQTLESR